MAEEVGHLPGREGADRSARLFNSVDQIGGEGMAEGMESPLFQAGRFQDAVVSFPEFHRPSVASVFIRDERAVLSEVSFCSQIQDGVHCRLIEGDIPLAGGRFQFADLYLSAAGGFAPLPPGDLLHAPLKVEDAVLQINVAVQQAERLSGPESGVQHQRIGGRLLVDACSVALGLVSLGLELRDLLRGEDGHSFEGWQFLFALTGHKA